MKRLWKMAYFVQFCCGNIQHYRECMQPAPAGPGMFPPGTDHTTAYWTPPWIVRGNTSYTFHRCRRSQQGMLHSRKLCIKSSYLKGYSHIYTPVLILTVLHYGISNGHTIYKFQILSYTWDTALRNTPYVNKARVLFLLTQFKNR
jgi:hypothetical protein